MNKATKSIVVEIIAAIFLIGVLWLLIAHQYRELKPEAGESQSLKSGQDKLSFIQKKKINPEDFYKPNPSIVAQIADIFTTPIEFYGKVVDQHGNAVEGADVEFSVSDDPTLSGRRNVQHRTTDALGLFEITGIRGIAIYVSASKPGYYKVYDNPGSVGQDASQRSFNYSKGKGPGLHQPDKSNAAVLVLHKSDNSEPLIHQPKEAWAVSNDGKPRRIPLSPKLPNGPHSIFVECLLDEKQKNSKGHYPWKIKLSVPNGELALRKGRLEFEAPTEGYSPSVEYNMPTTPADARWSDIVIGSYFVHFHDGHFGRFDFRFTAYRDSDIDFESHLNPKVGSRNLAADPNKHR
jgi:hypothetical protein